MNRRDTIKSLGLVAGAMMLPGVTVAEEKKKAAAKFKFCLNTSTISGQKPGLKKTIEIAAKSGYDSLELWIPEVKAYKEEGNSLATLKKYIDDNHVTVENAIGFAPWMVNDDAQREAGVKQLREEMEMMRELGCKRIAAAPAGVKAGEPLDLFKVGERYKNILDLGRQTGVMPQLEFWGASPSFYHLGQVLMAAAVANDPDVHILPDIYHLFRGGS
ncbi:MAG TPA: TIM barrel protein, partial [Ohtaekwangia sp.]|nr:TIM barrel protein [Ohtaekwangia sp.]